MSSCVERALHNSREVFIIWSMSMVPPELCRGKSPQRYEADSAIASKGCFDYLLGVRMFSEFFFVLLLGF